VTTKPPALLKQPDLLPVPSAVPEGTPGALQLPGGSQSVKWNLTLTRQVLGTLWIKNSDEKTQKTQTGAALEALMGIAPRDELEGMMAAQLLAAHNAAMECYRRAMIPKQSFEGHRESLTQANKLSRTSTMMIEALNKHRGKGQQKVVVEHVHVHAGAQAVVGVVERPGPSTQGGGVPMETEE
jgi:hypothetical protein